MSGEHAIDVHFQEDKPDLCHLTRGEGNALSFVLEDFDLSTRFAAALREGQFLKSIQAGSWELRYTPDDEETRKFKESIGG